MKKRGERHSRPNNFRSFPHRDLGDPQQMRGKFWQPPANFSEASTWLFRSAQKQGLPKYRDRDGALQRFAHATCNFLS